MAFTFGGLFRASVSVGANAGRASASHGGFAASTLAVISDCASVNGAMPELVRKGWSSRFPSNLALRRGRMGRGIMTVDARLGEGRVMRRGYLIAARRVTCPRSGRAASPCITMSPNPAVNRTPAGVAAHGTRFVGAGYLDR